MTPSRIDAHMHFWQYDAQSYPWIDSDMAALAHDRLPADVHTHLTAHSVDAVVAVQARGSREETQFLLELSQHHPWIAGVVGWEDVMAEDLPQRLDQWRAWPQLCGFRHQVQDEADARAFLEAPAFARGIALLQQKCLSYDLLVLHEQLRAGVDFCKHHDQHWLVLDHLGKPPLALMARQPDAFGLWQQDLQRFGALPHVVCKLSGLVTEADWRRGLDDVDKANLRRCLDAALRVFGPLRLMFGSDWPVSLLAAPYKTVLSLISDWADGQLSDAEKHQLWCGTAIRCYGLESVMKTLSQ